MKKNFPASVATCIILLACNASSHGQVSANAVALNHPEAVIEKIPTDDFDGHSFAMLNPEGINIKAVRDFTQSNKLAENVHWYKVSDGIMAYFTKSGIKTKTGYDVKGNWLYTMRSYEETMLPKEVRAQVKSVYYDYAITWVNEIIEGRQTIYVVHLQDKTSYKNIRVCEGEEMEETENLLK
ncbi:MAG: hypothetical protein ABJB86_08990 [Bacteroidota bacterium]